VVPLIFLSVTIPLREVLGGKRKVQSADYADKQTGSDQGVETVALLITGVLSGF
jgi:hypothetical protein